jgi:transposase
MSSTFGVFLGLDVGKGSHHAVGLDPSGKRLHDGALPNSEPKLRALFDKLATQGPLLVVVDQPATIGALPVAVARACGHQVAYLPGLAMRRIADLYPGRAKTDARDAFIIADAARSLPHTLRPVDVGDDTLAELEVLVGFDDDLAGEATRIANRIRGLLTGIHPALERAIGPRISHPAVLEILSRCGGTLRVRVCAPPASARPVEANSPPSRRSTLRAWATNSSPRSLTHSTSRPSPSPAPLPRTP